MEIKLNELESKRKIFQKSVLINYYFNILLILNLYLPIQTFYFYKNELTIITTTQFINFICYFLKIQTYLQFQILNSIIGLDNLNRLNRFELIYDLLSIQYNFRLRIKIYSNELNTTFFSITNIFLNACWWEREIWDLFGIYFLNNPDLRTILTDYGFEGYPLRKDFPLSGYLELNYNSIKQTCTYNFIELTQILKNLNTNSVWF